MSWQDQILAMAPRGLGHIDPPGLRAYIRVTRHYINGVVVPTVDLGNVEADEPGAGAFSAWFPELEALAQSMNRIVFVESILNRRLEAWLDRRGYQPVRGSIPPSMVSPSSSKEERAPSKGQVVGSSPTRGTNITSL